MKSACDTPTSNDAYVYEVRLNYLEQIRTYGMDKGKFTDVQLYGRTALLMSGFRRSYKKNETKIVNMSLYKKSSCCFRSKVCMLCLSAVIKTASQRMWHGNKSVIAAMCKDLILCTVYICEL